MFYFFTHIQRNQSGPLSLQFALISTEVCNSAVCMVWLLSDLRRMMLCLSNQHMENTVYALLQNYELARVYHNEVDLWGIEDFKNFTWKEVHRITQHLFHPSSLGLKFTHLYFEIDIVFTNFLVNSSFVIIIKYEELKNCEIYMKEFQRITQQLFHSSAVGLKFIKIYLEIDISFIFFWSHITNSILIFDKKTG